MSDKAIPVIDLFAGPGGLAEGFSSLHYADRRLFSVCLSVEMEGYSFCTLQLRSFLRKFPPTKAPEEYYRFVRGEISLDSLYSSWPVEAAQAAGETWKKEIGSEGHVEIDRRISSTLDGSRNWVLIGGPPCQAYSNAGMVGNRTRTGYSPEGDERYYLYRDYIRILAVHAPAVFVLENVPGMLAAKLNGERIIDSVLEGLSEPGRFLQKEYGEKRKCPGYRLLSYTMGPQPPQCDPRSFIVRCETMGMPQARHRVIIIGVRDDIDTAGFVPHATPQETIAAGEVLDGLPQVRSTLSREEDSLEAWRSVFASVEGTQWLVDVRSMYGDGLSRAVLRAAEILCSRSPHSSGAEFVKGSASPRWAPDWYADPRLGGVPHHQARPHIRPDLLRYLFSSCFTEHFDRSPKLHEYPRGLLPAHRNTKTGNFKDRFRTIRRDAPSGTVLSHLAKDGHAFIHYDPLQCRSLTPREAARLQTFPDNYFFFGGRAAQFRQIGNAVPPWLAAQIAAGLASLLRQN